MIRKMFLAVFTCLSYSPSLFSSTHSVYVEPIIEDFLSLAHDQPNQTIEVLLVFKDDKDKYQWSDKQRHKLINFLRDQNTRQLAELTELRLIDSSNIEKLWIINGFFTALTVPQLAKITEHKDLRGVYWAKKPIKMKKLASRQLNFMDNYTYGLRKLNVPTIRETAPQPTGEGVRVGILDTGIVPQHPDLVGRLTTYKNFSPSKNEEPADGFGHGTHVAGTIVGGSSSGLSIGVAPQAELIVGRLFDHNGSSERKLILMSMQWVADPDDNPKTDDHAQVVNSSWSDDDPYDDRLPENEPFCQIIDSWLLLNMIPVFSAGNGGPRDGSIHLPGGCPGAVSVGATEQNDRSPHFSSTGPAKWKDLDLLKPEVSAPGFNIKSADARGGYEVMSGTSMAAPHVTGGFAILLQAFPNASAADLITAMQEGAKDLGKEGQDKLFGWGRIDLSKSLELLEQ